MKLPDLLRREKRSAIDRQDRMEKALARSFRALSRLCSRMADFIETQRLQRQGYKPQGEWLERLDKRE
jgi:hypothetical protein